MNYDLGHNWTDEPRKPSPARLIGGPEDGLELEPPHDPVIYFTLTGDPDDGRHRYMMGDDGNYHYKGKDKDNEVPDEL